MKNNEVVLITGCSSGIGRELSLMLSDKGYTVVATARNANTLIDLPVSFKLPLDVTDKESISQAVNEIVSKFQRIDILINNAGFSVRGAMEEICPESMKSMFDVNVFGIVNVIQAVVPVMRRNQYGKIINIGSISGKFTQPINGVYCASKHAVEALSDALRYELHNQNIQVTVIEPGPIQTNFFKTMDKQSDKWMENPAPVYKSLYAMDAKRKEKQSYTEPNKVAEMIGKIIGKERLKSRYEVAVPNLYSMFARFPYSLRDYLMMTSR
ncbi:MAG TPA: SDR family oxidoreductase [Clostridia bacterium]|nr:SDR family oxidoreductase [Clostridia bacterium]